MNQPECVYAFGVFELDLRRGELRKHGRATRLQPQPFKVLKALVERAGDVVTRDELRQEVWPSDTFVDFDQSLNFCIRQIRTVLGDDADSPRFVETVPRRGYRFLGQPTLGNVSTSKERAQAPVVRQWPRTGYLAAIAGGVSAVAVVVAAVFPRAAAPPAPRIGFEIAAPTGTTFGSPRAASRPESVAGATPAVSPHGTQIAFIAYEEDSVGAVWIRRLDGSGVRRLEGTSGAKNGPFWSYSSREVAFFTPDALKSVSLDSMAVRTITAVVDGRSGSWSPVGDAILIAAPPGRLLRVPASGGTPAPMAREIVGDVTAASSPVFLPDGRRFLYEAMSADARRRGLFVGSLDGETPQRVMDASSNVAFVEPGYLLFAVDKQPNVRMPWRGITDTSATLFAQRFDAANLRVIGAPTAIADNVQYVGNDYSASFSASNTGVLAYRQADAPPVIDLAWFSRAGTPLGTLERQVVHSHPAISPDGTRVAIDRLDADTHTPDIWILDLLHRSRARTTFEASTDMTPIWSPDGSRIAFASDRSGVFALYVRDPAAGRDELLLKTEGDVLPTSWSPDGQYIVYQHYVSTGGYELDALKLSEPGRHTVLSAAQGGNAQGQFSADGHWLAFAANDHSYNSFEVFAEPFPPTGARWQISHGGGRQPFWRGDGREIFWLAPDWQHVMAADVTVVDHALRVGEPHALFAIHVWPGPPPPRNHYAVTSDGQRFLIDTMVADPVASPITVVVNWGSRTAAP